MFVFPKLKNYKFVFDFLQTRMVYAIYDAVFNKTNNQYFYNTLNNEEIGLTDTIHVVHYIPPFMVPVWINADKKGLATITYYQFQGFMVDLGKFSNLDEYLKDTLGSKTRKMMGSSLRRLETCFNIRYERCFGEIPKAKYDLLFQKLHSFLYNRFLQRGETHELLSQWEEIKNNTYDMILNKTASLSVIYNESEPIDINLSYHFQNIYHNAIGGYDIDYSKFSLGHIGILKQLEWCFENDVQLFDLSAGDMQYKRRWSNMVYDFEHQIIYDRNSKFKTTLAHCLAKYYKAKEFLKKKNVHKIYHKIRQLGHNEPNSENQYSEQQYTTLALDVIPDLKNTTLLDYQHKSYSFLRKPVADFQFRYIESSENIKVYEDNEHMGVFYIIGKMKMQQLQRV